MPHPLPSSPGLGRPSSEGASPQAAAGQHVRIVHQSQADSGDIFSRTAGTSR